MRYMPAKPPPLDLEQTGLITGLGERLRLARLRRRLTAEDVAARAGTTRMTLYRLERGEPAVSLGTLMRVLGALGLQSQFQALAAGDAAGHAMQDEALARRRPLSRNRIRVDQYPQLAQLAWNLAPGSELSAQEAFGLYERNWRHVEPDHLVPRERALLRRLERTVGKGVMLV